MQSFSRKSIQFNPDLRTTQSCIFSNLNSQKHIVYVFRSKCQLKLMDLPYLIEFNIFEKSYFDTARSIVIPEAEARVLIDRWVRVVGSQRFLLIFKVGAIWFLKMFFHVC